MASFAGISIHTIVMSRFIISSFKKIKISGLQINHTITKNKNKNKNIYYSNQWAHNRGKQIAYIDYCHCH